MQELLRWRSFCSAAGFVLNLHNCLSFAGCGKLCFEAQHTTDPWNTASTSSARATLLTKHRATMAVHADQRRNLQMGLLCGTRFVVRRVAPCPRDPHRDVKFGEGKRVPQCACAGNQAPRQGVSTLPRTMNSPPGSWRSTRRGSESLRWRHSSPLWQL